MDTVGIEIIANTAPELEAQTCTPGLYNYYGFAVKSGLRPNRNGSELMNYFEAIHDDPHIFVYGCNGKVKKVTFSISEVLHGTNGILIKNQQQVDAALLKAKGLPGHF
jgi:hypothetical protein